MGSFNENIEFDENKVKTKVIVETSFSKEIRIALMRGQNMKEHKTPFPILIHLLDGSIELGVEGKIFSMKKGNIIALEGNIPHDLTANENSIVRLSLSKHDKVERLNDVIN
ncbi:cupin domain-containing protein [Arcicella rosea]|uniref:Quercetin dioxygenase-like cupin family protein n=1 Tax=Arcicella rosea TaxID=502909 RepID=A0A841ETD2_9BACT|nr:cupin domain-containing protein [Arcicella rosea]MBB6002711.1 quercetin dioxygenase-like cupin family protein [Arcicella rosea]